MKTTSPHHPQSIWERSVQTVEKLLKKANFDGTEPCFELLAYRTSPLCSDKFGRSPSIFLKGENIRTRLPVSSRGEWICEQKQQTPGRNVTLEYYNKAAHDLQEVKEGDTVSYRVYENNWDRKGVVKSKEITPRSYIV